MKAAVLTRAEHIEIRELPMAKIQTPTEVLVKVKAIGICGTDIHVYKGERQDVEYPRVMGHELSGIVEKTGPSVSQLQEGDHVIFDPVLACHACRACKDGHENVCGQVKCFGVQADGGFQEYIAVEEASLYKIPKEVPFETAALGEPFSIAANILSKAQVKAGEQVLILGAGTIGISILQIAKNLQAKVMMSDISEKKLEHARAFGADVLVNSRKEDLEEVIKREFENHVDVIIDAVGLSVTLESAVRLASPCTRIVVIGFDSHDLKISPSDITRKELVLLGSRMNNKKFPQVVQWLKEGVITDKMISKYYSLEELDHAFQETLKHGEEWMKTMIRMEDTKDEKI